jgi:hypothetical protein
VQLHPAPSVTGKITLENGRPADGVRQVRLFSVDDLQDQYLPLMIRGRLDVGKDGSFSLAGLSSGSFYVQINGCPADCMRGISPTGYYLKSIRFNGQDVTNKPLFLPAAGSSTLEIVVAPGAAEASGTVRDADNRPLPNTRVTLWSDSVHITDLTSNDGSFDFRDLAPGEYHILAWEQIEPGLDAIPAFRDKFSAKATTFKVDVSGQAHYDISPVGSDAIQAEAAKLP